MQTRWWLKIGLLTMIGGVGIRAQFSIAPAAPKARPWLENKNLSPDERADLVIAQMTVDEKIQLVHGAGMAGLSMGGPVDPALVRANGGGGFVPGIERLGLPDLNMADSAAGVGRGAFKGRYSTALPSPLALASSWDTRLALEYGTLIGRELAEQGYNVSLAGGVDITREPRNGRNFEYQGEDPILAGNMVSGLINGIQSQGIIGDVKHYALNDEETGRYFENIISDRRSMRETDLLAFEIAIRAAHPGMVMCSYNMVNSMYACENDYLLNQVLKHDWGFKGWVISDWFATHSTVTAALAGLDQQQPLGNLFGEELKKAVGRNDVPMSRLNDMVHRIVRTEFASGIIDHRPATAVPDVGHGLEVAQAVEEQSAVLLKNQRAQLPLDAKKLKRVAVIGGHADVGVLSGGGSAQVDPAGGNAVPQDPAAADDIAALLTAQVWHRSSPLKAIQAMVPDAQISFEAGGDLARAAAAAKQAEVAIVFVSQHTHEGNDLNTLALSGNQDALVEAVAAANPHTVVVVESGAAVLMPWAGKVSAVLEAWYPGIAGGTAIANLLFGRANPSGKLAVTFPMRDEDLPRPNLPAPSSGIPGPLDGVMKPMPIFEIHYDECLKVGYKWYEAEDRSPRYAFGHGLSYSRFQFSGMQARGGSGLRLSFAVQNVSKLAGKETAQVYLRFPAAAGEPAKRLVGWEKVSIPAGETHTIKLEIDPLYLSVFNVKTDKWEIVAGDYEVYAGAASNSLPLHAMVHIGG